MKVLEHVYEPRGACNALFSCREPEVLISGPAGTGKSRACLEKLHLMALVNPGMRGLIIRKTLASLGSTALVTWREHVVAEALENRTVEYYGGSAEHPAQYRYSNGSVVVVGGMDKASKIMSSEYDAVYVQEATELTEDDWEALSTRLRHGKISFQQLMGDANPNAPTHWLAQRNDKGQTLRLESRHEDNPLLYENDTLTERGTEYMARLDALTGVRYARLRKGLWVAAEGIIYDDYDPALHLLQKPKDPPKEWPRYWVVDFGYTNPFVCQWWVEDPDGRLLMYRELYHTKRTVDEHAKRMLRAVTKLDGTWKEPRPRAIICDHDAEGRAVLERELGMGTTAAHKAVTEGIQAVQARMRKAGDGRPPEDRHRERCAAGA